jgi:hypothetical protein
MPGISENQLINVIDEDSYWKLTLILKHAFKNHVYESLNSLINI